VGCLVGRGAGIFVRFFVGRDVGLFVGVFVGSRVGLFVGFLSEKPLLKNKPKERCTNSHVLHQLCLQSKRFTVQASKFFSVQKKKKNLDGNLD